MNAQDLKNSILQLAVQGKLVEQRAEEGTARELLEQIKLEKDQLIKDKKIKKSKPLPEITEDEIPFEIPESWEWVRLNDITNENTLNDGDWVLSKDMVDVGEVKLIQLGSIGNCQYIEKGFKYLTKKHFEEIKGTQIYDGYLLINRLIGERMLECIIPRIDGILMTAVDVCWIAPQEKYYDIQYIMYVLASAEFQKRVKGLGRGTTRFRISKGNLINIPFPLPPLEEQHRIVAKIEEILPYIDQYDKAYTKLEAFNKKFPEDMKKSILQMAMQGKLVEQRPEEGTADELYEQVVAEKAQLIKEGKIKKEKPLPEITEDEIPFEIPSSWKWVRFQEVCAVLTCGYASTPEYVAENIGMPFISAKNIKPYKFMPDDHKYIKRELYDKLTQTCCPKKNDILLTRVGAGIGEAAIIDIDMEFAIYVSLTLIKLVDYKQLDNRYILYWLNSPIGTDNARKNIFGKGASQGNLNVNNVRTFLVPLPPLEEQKRIVAKIEELLPYCDQLIK